MSKIEKKDASESLSGDEIMNRLLSHSTNPAVADKFLKKAGDTKLGQRREDTDMKRLSVGADGKITDGFQDGLNDANKDVFIKKFLENGSLSFKKDPSITKVDIHQNGKIIHVNPQDQVIPFQKARIDHIGIVKEFDMANPNSVKTEVRGVDGDGVPFSLIITSSSDNNIIRGNTTEGGKIDYSLNTDRGDNNRNINTVRTDKYGNILQPGQTIPVFSTPPSPEVLLDALGGNDKR